MVLKKAKALKQVSELNKAEKLLFLAAIKSGEIDKETLTPDIHFAIKYSDYFLSLMVAASPGNENMDIICLGEARKAKNDLEFA